MSLLQDNMSYIFNDIIHVSRSTEIVCTVLSTSQIWSRRLKRGHKSVCYVRDVSRGRRSSYEKRSLVSSTTAKQKKKTKARKRSPRVVRSLCLFIQPIVCTNVSPRIFRESSVSVLVQSCIDSANRAVVIFYNDIHKDIRAIKRLTPNPRDYGFKKRRGRLRRHMCRDTWHTSVLPAWDIRA